MSMAFGVSKIRGDFPLLQKQVYLDSACQSLVPRQVVETLRAYYLEYPACGGRSMHRLGQRVTDGVADSRDAMRKFVNARSSSEIIFTKNATESMNLVAHALSISGTVVQSDKEHNSCLLPFQSRAKILPVQSMSENGFDLSAFDSALRQKPSIVAMQHASNLDGTQVPAKEIVKLAHAKDVPVLLDGAQFAPHHALDLKKLDVDFYAWSSHKMLGPHLGVLYARADWHPKMKPFMLGGGTVTESTYESKKLEEMPARFEAGLQDYGAIIAYRTAIEYLRRIGMDAVAEHEVRITRAIADGMKNIPGTTIIGPSPEKRSGITSFYHAKMDVHTIALMLDRSADIQVRSGQHCVHSWFSKNKIAGSVRASAYCYTSMEDVKAFISALANVLKAVR